MKQKIGKLTMGSGASSTTRGLALLLVILLGALIVISFMINRETNRDKKYIGYAGELRVLSQEIAKNATEAAGGKAEAFDELKRSRDDFERYWNYLSQRSEEHTSELQSRPHLVCRLLLEKKK